MNSHRLRFCNDAGITRDLGLYDDPDAFYAEHRQMSGVGRGGLYRHAIRRCMNARVANIRRGRVPSILDGGLDAPPADAGPRAGAS
ncbi:hypothetical protein RM543_16475 [Roseicyclus sp. F158]|uniref:Uncharacterized protein n=1 Tax=Tropicimonas omnivorans TaxID=3075590 RepID=A0ABU3DKN8_9RHOB|nr:hypothetical protein [Roseicyclus sp. F158]MDT0684279.1 hypothetical protein [Roseicyclus sp. F158]